MSRSRDASATAMLSAIPRMPKIREESSECFLLSQNRQQGNALVAKTQLTTLGYPDCQFHINFPAENVRMSIEVLCTHFFA